MLTTACCLVVGLGLRLGFDLVSAWLVVMYTHLYHFPLSKSHCRPATGKNITRSRSDQRSTDELIDERN